MKLNNKYLIALDLDGTLLKDNKKISLKSIFYIRKLVKLNNVVVISSGRPIRAIKTYYKQLKLNSPIIAYNGAEVISLNDSCNYSFKQLFKKEIILEIIKKLKENNILLSMMSETEKKIWVDKEDDFLFAFFLSKNMKVLQGNFEDILDEDPITFIVKFIDTPQNREIIKNIVSKYEDIDVRFWQSNNYFELHYKHISKYNKILEIAKLYNIKEENIYAFGDADNDIDTLHRCPNGVAMINAPKLLKDIAKYTTTYDNNHDGVIRFLKENLK